MTFHCLSKNSLRDILTDWITNCLINVDMKQYVSLIARNESKRDDPTQNHI